MKTHVKQSKKFISWDVSQYKREKLKDNNFYMLFSTGIQDKYDLFDHLLYD
jgi:hypothetical protein